MATCAATRLERRKVHYGGVFARADFSRAIEKERSLSCRSFFALFLPTTHCKQRLKVCNLVFEEELALRSFCLNLNFLVPKIVIIIAREKRESFSYDMLKIRILNYVPFVGR